MLVARGGLLYFCLERVTKTAPTRIVAILTRQSLTLVLTCIALLSLPVLFSPDLGDPGRMLHSPGFISDFIGYSVAVLFFFLNYYLLVPRLYFHKKYTWFFLAALVGFIMIAVLSDVPQWFNWYPEPRQGGGPARGAHTFGFHELRNSSLRFAIAFLISWLLRIEDRWQHTVAEKMQAELAFLRTQINPHFLFNTLNSIYALAIGRSEQTPEAVAKLSALMRYVTNEASRELVPLEKEIEYIRNYIDLQKIRFGDTVQLEFSVEIEPSGHRIAPLILIPFIENAFKHGVNPEEHSKIAIAIQMVENHLKLEVFNKKVQHRTDEDSQSGLGIENTRSRLGLMYPDRYELDIGDRPESFSVSLTLDL